MRMFGGISDSFFSAYSEILPPQPGHEKRAALYELHHHMNHYNIFGRGYRAGVLELMQRLLK